MRKHFMLAVVALLSACTDKNVPPAAQGNAGTVPVTAPAAAPAPSSPSAPDMLSAEGFQAVRFGMQLAEAEQAVGGKAILPEPFDPVCSMVRFDALPGLRFMLEHGVVTRADAGPGLASALGRIGDTLEQVRRAHPEVHVSVHKYDANGHYLSLPSADGRSAIILEESGGKVTKMRAGLQPAVSYVETCG
ncbi:hypothetical protein [Massilia sp. X63]|uniref:hypothetical protein n=1 Tax=Massilia sp. X63 TaxID=3237285 RepID=UPI0034DDA88A